jgi:hypothetical protein
MALSSLGAGVKRTSHHGDTEAARRFTENSWG